MLDDHCFCMDYNGCTECNKENKTLNKSKFYAEKK